MSKLVNWTVEDRMQYPFGKDGQVINLSHSKKFSIDKIREEEFSFKTCNSFFRPVKDFLSEKPGTCGLESVIIEITHKKNDPDVSLSFQIKKGTGRFDWGEYKTLHFEVSFKSQNLGIIEGVWHVIKAFSIPLRDEVTDLQVTAKLCHIDVLKDYIIHRDSHLWGLIYFPLTLPIQVTGMYSKTTNPILKVPRHGILNETPMNLMKKILSESLFSDFNILVGERTFPCHRNILAGQSEVFRAMFDSKMTERHSNKVVIEDMSAAGVEALLKYMYYKDVADPNSNCAIALELLKAGHKYQIKDLESECGTIIHSMDSKKFDVKTAFDLFEFCGMVQGFEGGQVKATRVLKENAARYDETKELEAVLAYVKPKVVAKLFNAMALL